MSDYNVEEHKGRWYVTHGHRAWIVPGRYENGRRDAHLTANHSNRTDTDPPWAPTRLPRIKGSNDHDWPSWGETPIGRGRTCKRCGCEDDGYRQPCKETP